MPHKLQGLLLFGPGVAERPKKRTAILHSRFHGVFGCFSGFLAPEARRFKCTGVGPLLAQGRTKGGAVMPKNTSVDHALSSDIERIGLFLVRIGAMQSWQLEKVLQLQRSGDVRRFGEIAIDLGYIEDAALKLYVDSRCNETQQSSCVCAN
jgi:hypothetical protein